MDRESNVVRNEALAAAVDMDVLNRFKAELVDIAPELVVELMTFYVDNTPAFLIDLRQALATNDAELITRKAHQLKANSARLGAMGCSALCEAIEMAGERNEFDNTGGMIDQLEIEYKRVEAVFRQLLQA